MQEENISFIQCSIPKFQILYELEWHTLNSFHPIRLLGENSTRQVVRAQRHGKLDTCLSYTKAVCLGRVLEENFGIF